MVGPDGKVGPNRHRDTAHVPERRIGDILDADDDAGSGKVVRVTFAPEDGGPRVTLQMTFASVAEVEM
nr:hypothetical protein [Paracoccaceae bacterium]